MPRRSSGHTLKWGCCLGKPLPTRYLEVHSSGWVRRCEGLQLAIWTWREPSNEILNGHFRSIPVWRQVLTLLFLTKTAFLMERDEDDEKEEHVDWESPTPQKASGKDDDSQSWPVSQLDFDLSRLFLLSLSNEVGIR